MPGKKYFVSEDDLNMRQLGLQTYLQALVGRKDTRNATSIIKFLSLDVFCPEILYNKPQLLVKIQYIKNSYVTHSLFIPKHNLFAVVVYDRT